MACDEKSNEITAIPELLKLVDIKGAIITIDAMGTQKAIAAEIVEGEADYVLALKGNQETLHQAVIDHIDEQLEEDFAARGAATKENGHGREETRTYLQLPAPQSLPGFTLWKGLKSIGVVISDAFATERRPLRFATTSAVWPVGVSVRPRRPRSLGDREHLPLESRSDLSRGRVADRDEKRCAELRLAQPLHVVAPQAASRPREPGHETPQLRLERRLPDGSPYWSNV